MTRRRWAAGLMCLSLLSYAGCTEDDSKADTESTSSITMPTPAPSESPSTTTSMTREPTPPDLPAAADGSGDKAARAFAKHWIEAANYAMTTGDTKLLASLHADSCSSCDGGVEQVDKDWSNGGALVGGQYTVLRVRSLRSSKRDVHVVALETKHSKQLVLNSKGKQVARAPAGLTAFKLYLRHDGEGWLVGDVEALQ